MKIKKKLLTILIFLFCTSAFSFTVPALKAHVNDYANLLDAKTISLIESKLSIIEQLNTTQVVILTVNRLNGDTIENAAYEVFNTWKLGQANHNNGVLLLVAKMEREVRIEVGEGLEGILTDAVSGRIIDNILIPKLKEGDFSGGLYNAADKISSLLINKNEKDFISALKKGNNKISKEKYVFPMSVFYISLVPLGMFACYMWFRRSYVITPLYFSILGAYIFLNYIQANLVSMLLWITPLYMVGWGFGYLLDKSTEVFGTSNSYSRFRMSGSSGGGSFGVGFSGGGGRSSGGGASGRF